MKLYQLNTWAMRLEKVIFASIASQAPDVLCLQEVTSVPSGEVAVFGRLENLQTRFPEYKYCFFSPVFSFKTMSRATDFRNAILSKLPIVDSQTIFTRDEHLADFDFVKHDYNIRNFQHATVKTSSGPVHILNHHGHHVPGHKRGDAETSRQMAMILNFVKDINGPLILAGDFNLSPASKSLAGLNRQLINLSLKYKLKTTRTSLTDKKEVCDYIFVDKKTKVKHFAMLPETVSDHAALVVEI